ncbi:MAG: phosphoenolpyruvate--protein phosphotransferase [Deltaproteobacteria bacterium]|nr:phosphoenolpyruvate--protein phosphotransferase [Deltaproteobacteria bacterium]
MKERAENNKRYHGIGVSPGIAIGKAFLFSTVKLEVPAFCYLDEAKLNYEVERFTDAVSTSKAQLQKIREKMLEDSKGRGKEHVRIIDAHIMMMEDDMLVSDTISHIESEGVNAEWALKTVLQSIKEFFDEIEDEYLRERGSDIEYIGDRILSNLMGRKREKMPQIDEEVIIIARDLTPTDTAQIPGSKIRGFLTDLGGRTSHTAVFARAIEIPAIVGLDDITRVVSNGDILIVDGSSGAVVINPTPEVLEEYRKIKEEFSSYEHDLHHYTSLPAVTVDGYTMKLMGNIEFVEEVPGLMEHGAEGVGLYRTEYLYLNRRDLPSEDEHFQAYKKVAEMVAPHDTIIRTFDIGGDKLLSQMENLDEANPAMGLRAIRFCLKKTDIFKVQLRGILRASVFGKVKVMFPMISGIKELRMAKSILDDARTELRDEGKAYDEGLEIGIMIEVPSAALIADLLAKEVDFFSIGTNDLLQYCLAIDRGNDHVDYLYDPLHPAVLRIIKSVVRAARYAGIEVGLCGEIAGEPQYTKVLIALGLDQLSMNALSVLRVKKEVRTLNYGEILKLTEENLAEPDAANVRKLIN